ncbi:unnamed protein product [Rotaria sp. Silwood1]|nr:unnamed protein product [Rotaria sp. Silwood1]CAF1532310.1 unnamed protein product [Rotaria sp. Silwood1]CAF3616941.1 unnamed protein product [Rotaria sp. Silwood1]CAF3668572.1 unnamed protein product [Rotaria sp. Silwood1]CAF4900797.1 unnamed protein product [Rotaria sp. Silwood1]
MLYVQNLLNKKLKSLKSKLSTNVQLDLIEQIYEYQMKSNEIEEKANVIHQQLEDLIDEDKQNVKKQLFTKNNRSESDQNRYLENHIENLRNEIEQLNLKLDEINNYIATRESQEQLQIYDTNGQSDNVSEIIESPPSQTNTSHLRSTFSNSRNSLRQQEDDNTVLSHLLLKLISPLMLDLNESELGSTEAENEMVSEDEETVGVIGASTAPRISRKIRLSNTIVHWLRGPFKVMVDGTLHAVDVFARGTHVSDDVLQAVKKGIDRQKQMEMKQQTTNNSLKPAFTEITSDWTIEGENRDKGFSNESIWMLDPQRQRVLVKIQDHPLCAANEWLAYVLGTTLGLSVNEAQISVYKSDLVTLHSDAANENEKTITFMKLPKQRRKTLLTDPTIGSMDLLDHIIQNVDRNPRNILITMPKDASIDDDTVKLKMHLIDHDSCFGMGKLNVISIVACKLHSPHLAVVKFDSIEQAKKFEQYLSKLPVVDRISMKKTLNRFAAITDDQFDRWLTEIHDLLSPNQYDRIRDVLYRQRDIAKRYTIQWCMSSNVTQNETNQIDIQDE